MRSRDLVALVPLLLAGLAGGVSAHVTPVSILGNGTPTNRFRYSPSTVTVSQQDSVKWTNLSNVIHSATSGDPNDQTFDGEFDTGLMGVNQARNVRFNTPGDFTYYCQVHPDQGFYPGFNGVVHVLAATPVSPLSWSTIRRNYSRKR